MIYGLNVKNAIGMYIPPRIRTVSVGELHLCLLPLQPITDDFVAKQKRIQYELEASPVKANFERALNELFNAGYAPTTGGSFQQVFGHIYISFGDVVPPIFLFQETENTFSQDDVFLEQDSENITDDVFLFQENEMPFGIQAIFNIPTAVQANFTDAQIKAFIQKIIPVGISYTTVYY